MNQNPTPETDAVFQTIAVGDFVNPLNDGLHIAKDHAEKLERERNELRVELERAKSDRNRIAKEVRAELLPKLQACEQRADRLERENGELRKKMALYHSEEREIAELNSALKLANAELEKERECRAANQDGVRNLNRTVDELTAKLAATVKAGEVSLVRAYAIGYQNGHNDSVDGNFISIHKADEPTFFRDVVISMLMDGSLPEFERIALPGWAATKGAE